jgi:hypothetical protein
MRRSVFFAGVIFCGAAFAGAEVTRLPFLSPVSFTDTSMLCPAFTSWVDFSHTLNQGAAPDTAHCLDTGSMLTFWSCDRVAISGLARELFLFRESPNGAWQFWARALVTDLRLEAAARVPPFTLGAGYRHDCKHDIAVTAREVIHDAVFARAVLPLPRAEFCVEAEANLPTVFQAGPAESDRARLSAEAEFVPIKRAGIAPFIGGRASLIRREENGRVAVGAEWNADWLVRTGIDFRAGFGVVRLMYRLERITDDWATIESEPQTLSAISITLRFDAPRATATASCP